jgi:putative endonuclease
MYYVYILRSLEGKYYIGSTDNLQHRLSQHNDKTFKAWTNRYNGWELIYSEEYCTRKDALIRERQIKSYKGGKSFKILVEVARLGS